MTTQGNLPPFPAAYFETDDRGRPYLTPAFVAKEQVLPWADGLFADGLSITQLRHYFGYYCDIRQSLQNEGKSWEQVRRGFESVYEPLRNAGEDEIRRFRRFVRDNKALVTGADDGKRAFLEGFLPSFEALIGYFRSAEEARQWRDYDADAHAPAGYFRTDKKDNRHYLLPEWVARDKVGALAEELASQRPNLTMSQLRRFFNHCRRIEQRLEGGGDGWWQVAASFEMLRCYAYDARKGAKIPAGFHAFIDGNVERVTRAGDSAQDRECAFREGFMPHFEALVGYFTGKNVEGQRISSWEERKSPAWLAEELRNAETKIAKGQLRRFFDHCRRIESRLKKDDGESWERVAADFEMLCVYAQDARPKTQREKIPAEFQIFIEDSVRLVKAAPDRKGFFLERFMPYFEAVVGFSEVGAAEDTGR